MAFQMQSQFQDVSNNGFLIGSVRQANRQLQEALPYLHEALDGTNITGMTGNFWQVICRSILSPIMMLPCKANSACQSIKDKADHEITLHDDRVKETNS